ncbi:MAG: hypothetical protein CR964_01775 [Rhodobacterales bacterium]|nr:MAG: hypothetical protein CR964_01775 [Rhodobacterales bacterium]
MFRFAPLILSLALATPAIAGGKGNGLLLHERSPEAEQPTPADAPSITPRQQFIQSNVIETLYHELGHALIDILDLPVYGNEELAADVFSVVLMNRLHDEEEVAQLARDVANAYSEEARRAKLRGQPSSGARPMTHGTYMGRTCSAITTWSACSLAPTPRAAPTWSKRLTFRASV